jgi:hypothetical protein
MNRREFLVCGGAALASVAWPFYKLGWAGKVPEKELVMCLDWSGSMYSIGRPMGTPQNYLIQKEGHVAAVMDPEIPKLLLSGRVYVHVILWSGRMEEVEPIFKGQMQSLEDVLMLAGAIREKVPDRHSPSAATNHNTPLAFVASLPLSGKSRTIDISTDEPVRESNIGECLRLKARLIQSKTTINVLAIDQDEKGLKNLREYLQTPDGFTDHIESWANYIPAIKKKIKKELSFT